MQSKKFVLMYGIFGAFFLAMVLIFAPAHRSALACEPTLAPPGYVPPTPIPMETQVAGVIKGAQIVLDGTVQSLIPGPNSDSVLTVQVTRYLKGHGPQTVKISGDFWDCPPNFAFHEGSRSIFFVNGDPLSSKPLQAQTWFDANEDVVAGVRSVTGEEPKAPDVTYNVLWVSLLIIIVLGFILVMYYRRTRAKQTP